MQRESAGAIAAVDLFAGCGGMSLGFEKAGFDVKAAFDNWLPAIKVYRKNFKHPMFEQDLSDSVESAKLVSKYSPTVIFGGPPCQDFSTAGFQDETRGRAILSVSFAKDHRNGQTAMVRYGECCNHPQHEVIPTCLRGLPRSRLWTDLQSAQCFSVRRAASA